MYCKSFPVSALYEDINGNYEVTFCMNNMEKESLFCEVSRDSQILTHGIQAGNQHRIHPRSWKSPLSGHIYNQTPMRRTHYMLCSPLSYLNTECVRRSCSDRAHTGRSGFSHLQVCMADLGTVTWQLSKEATGHAAPTQPADQAWNPARRPANHR